MPQSLLFASQPLASALACVTSMSENENRIQRMIILVICCKLPHKVEIDFSSLTLLEIYEGIPMINSIEFLPLGGKIIHE